MNVLEKEAHDFVVCSFPWLDGPDLLVVSLLCTEVRSFVQSHEIDIWGALLCSITSVSFGRFSPDGEAVAVDEEEPNHEGCAVFDTFLRIKSVDRSGAATPPGARSWRHRELTCPSESDSDDSDWWYLEHNCMESGRTASDIFHLDLAEVGLDSCPSVNVRHSSIEMPVAEQPLLGESEGVWPMPSLVFEGESPNVATGNGIAESNREGTDTDVAVQNENGSDWVPVEILGHRSAYRIHRYLQRQDMHSTNEALRRAADRGHLDIIDMLLLARADPNSSADEVGVGFTQVGAYPLHIAAKRGNVEILGKLLTSNADIDVADQNGRTGLMVAIASGQISSAEWLIQNGAAVNSKSFYGFTPLIQAAQLPRYELIVLLLCNKASPHCVDQMDQTPLHIAIKSLSSHVKQADFSYDLQGEGDEYCYNRYTSHGSYGVNLTEVQNSEHESRVTKTVVELIKHGADLDARDSLGRSAGDILDSKNRVAMRGWLETLRPNQNQKTVHDTTAKASSSEVANSAMPCFTCFPCMRL